MICETTYAKCLAYSAKIENKLMRDRDGRAPTQADKVKSFNQKAKLGAAVRERIADILKLGPARTTDIATAVGLGSSMTRDHLRKLVKEGRAKILANDSTGHVWAAA